MGYRGVLDPSLLPQDAAAGRIDDDRVSLLIPDAEKW